MEKKASIRVEVELNREAVGAFTSLSKETDKLKHSIFIMSALQFALEYKSFRFPDYHVWLKSEQRWGYASGLDKIVAYYYF